MVTIVYFEIHVRLKTDEIAIIFMNSFVSALVFHYALTSAKSLTLLRALLIFVKLNR